MLMIILIKQSLYYSLDGPDFVLSETLAMVSLSTGINRCRHTETLLYVPTQQRPSSGSSAVDAPSL